MLIQQTETYKKWFNSLRDANVVARITARLKKIAEQNHFGDCEFVGDKVYELRILYGAGWRVYFKQDAAAIILLLCGGDKSTQARDIKKAKQMSKEN